MASAPKKNPQQDEVVILTDPAAMLAARFDQPSVTSEEFARQFEAINGRPLKSIVTKDSPLENGRSIRAAS